MHHTRNTSVRSPGRVGAAALLLVLCALPTVTAAAPAGAPAKLPGAVSGERFVALAGDTGQLVEIMLHGRLLRLVTSRAVKRHDQDLAGILGDLERLYAVIADVEDDRAAAEREIASVTSKLATEGWERFVRVRDEDGTNMSAWIHLHGEDHVDGLVVLGFAEGKQVVFVNLAGRIDMERIAILGEKLGVPGLDGLPPASEVEKQKQDREAAAKAEAGTV